MRLAVVFLREVAALSLFGLRQTTEGIPFQGLPQHFTAYDLTGKAQNLPHRYFQSLVRQLAENQLCLQRVHLSPENDSGVIFGNQYIPVKVGQVLRLFLHITAVQKMIPLGFRLFRRDNGNPFPVQVIPCAAGELVALAQVKNSFSIPVAEIRPDRFLVI